MKHFVFTVLLIMVSSSGIFAQEELLNYQKAKQMVANGEYVQAMDLLKPYLDDDQFGEVANYAAYHFSKAAYASRRYELAQTVLEQVIQERNWKHEEDAKYLLALSHFQQQNISEALQQIAALQDEGILKEAYRASYDFLQHVSTSVLIVNLPKFESNKGLVMALKNQLESRTVLSAGEKVVYNQIRNLKFSDAEDTGFSREVNETLEVAVILPFNYNGGSGVRGLGDNNFVFDLYKGIKFAVDEAKARGVSLVVRTFDTERKTEVVKKILEDPFLQIADIIVGPIYPEESDMVSQYAAARKIPFVNPLSNLSDNQDSEFAYLFRPSVKAISEGMLNYSKNLPGKKIALAFSGTTRDELLARQYAESAKKSGFQILQTKKVTPKDMRDFFEDLSINNGENKKVDQIVIFSDDPNIAAPTFGVMESLSTQIPILVMDSWLYFNFANYEMLEIQNFHFIGNNTVDVNKEEVDAFREAFFERHGIYPDLISHLGYEIIHWITYTINSQKGFDFQKNLDQAGFQNGALTFGFDFSNSRSNNYVPILRLENGVLEAE